MQQSLRLYYRRCIFHSKNNQLLIQKQDVIENFVLEGEQIRITSCHTR